MNKGMDLMIAVGKPKAGGPPRPPRMSEGAPMPPDEGMSPEEAQEDEHSDAKQYACLKRIERNMARVMEALGVEEEPDEDEGMGGDKQDEYGG
jgi:hypothetical protein